MTMKTNHSNRLGAGRAVASLALLSTALAACAQGPLCKTLGNCGGDPIGTWASIDDPNNPPGCIDGPFFQPTNVTSPGSPFDDTLTNRPAPAAGQPLAQPVLSDWCGGLQLQKDPLKPFGSRVFVFQDPQITKFGIVYNAPMSPPAPEGMAGTYQAGFRRSGRFGQYYSDTCINQFGSDPTDCVGMTAKILKDDPDGNYAGISCSSSNGGMCGCTWTDKGGQTQQQGGMQMYCTSVGVILNKEATDETFKNVTCSPDSEMSTGGCDCAFDVAYSSGESGYYKVDGNIITNYPESSSINYPSQMTFCVNGDVLDISGYGSSYLLNKAPVRTFHLLKVNP
jgi:hypothetical protein